MISNTKDFDLINNREYNTNDELIYLENFSNQMNFSSVDLDKFGLKLKGILTIVYFTGISHAKNCFR
jgi:hypothetical protein